MAGGRKDLKTNPNKFQSIYQTSLYTNRTNGSGGGIKIVIWDLEKMIKLKRVSSVILSSSRSYW